VTSSLAAGQLVVLKIGPNVKSDDHPGITLWGLSSRPNKNDFDKSGFGKNVI